MKYLIVFVVTLIIGFHPIIVVLYVLTIYLTSDFGMFIAGLLGFIIHPFLHKTKKEYDEP